jgi:hypothetical protein
MSLKTELKFVYVLAVVCLVVGVFCYSSLPAKTSDAPVRTMYKTVGGNVLFDHQTHADAYGLECLSCHHDTAVSGAETPTSCGNCHTPDTEYVPAFGEGGRFDHDMHSMDYGLSCSDCHHDYDEEEGGMPQMCSDCHEPGAGDDFMLGRVEAFHKQCIGCHEDSGITPGKNDCAGCHAPRKRTEAYHAQCIGCHEDFGAGPSGADADCIKCHGF